MAVIPIDSLDDSRIDAYRDLPRHRTQKQEGRFIAEGSLLVERLLASDFELESLFVEQGRAEELVARVPDSVPIYTAERGLFQDVIGFQFHRCVLASGRRRPNPTLSEIVSRLGENATVVVCDSVTDPENMGGILRNCAAFGIDAVLLGPNCTDPYSRRVLRVSMGTVFKLTLFESADLSADLRTLRKEHRFDLFATVLDRDAAHIETVRRAPRTGIVFGNEGHGMDSALATDCTRRVTIPMKLGTDSLNVSVAAGIFLYYFTREAS